MNQSMIFFPYFGIPTIAVWSFIERVVEEYALLVLNVFARVKEDDNEENARDLAARRQIMIGRERSTFIIYLRGENFLVWLFLSVERKEGR